jgi:hypothetical protein
MPPFQHTVQVSTLILIVLALLAGNAVSWSIHGHSNATPRTFQLAKAKVGENPVPEQKRKGGQQWMPTGALVIATSMTMAFGMPAPPVAFAEEGLPVPTVLLEKAIVNDDNTKESPDKTRLIQTVDSLDATSTQDDSKLVAEKDDDAEENKAQMTADPLGVPSTEGTKGDDSLSITEEDDKESIAMIAEEKPAETNENEEALASLGEETPADQLEESAIGEDTTFNTVVDKTVADAAATSSSGNKPDFVDEQERELEEDEFTHGELNSEQMAWLRNH